MCGIVNFKTPANYEYVYADQVTGWPEALALSARTLDRGIEYSLGHGSLPLVCPCCVVLRRHSPCDDLITRPRCPNVRRKADRKH
jgi:hypothetical protein